MGDRVHRWKETGLHLNPVARRHGDADITHFSVFLGFLPLVDNHTEDTWQIVYYTHGTGTLTVGDRKIPLSRALLSASLLIFLMKRFHRRVLQYTFSVRTMDNLGMEVPVFRDTRSRTFCRSDAAS